MLMAIQIWVFTAFSEVPKNALIRRCCLIHLKNSSNLPAAFVELRDGQGWEDEIVGEEYESLLCLGVEVADAAKGIGVVFRGLGCVQYNGLVAAQAGGFVDGTRRTPSVIQIAFGTDDKKSGLLREGIEPGKVDVTAVHDVEGAGFQNQFVEELDIVRFPLCYAEETGDIAA